MTRYRVCAEPGCPTLTQQRRCPTHARRYEQQRGTPTTRGYDAHHRTIRAGIARRLARGETIPCTRCGHPITKTDAWDLGHSDDRRTHTGPEHQNCNRSAGGRKSHRP